MRGTHRAFICFLLPILLFALAALDPARAQQQEKRIAFVVGNGAYARSPLATTANDAGLIAQTLQAAGFDVVGARDLDADTLRKSFRDFIQKAQASGPGTVAMIYLAGYGMQLAGENYFVPVDSNITRDTDVPTEALRVSDYVRQLAAIPLKASIVVLDAARAQPFIEGGQGIASGLALVEPDANMLIAFNAAPGTVAPEEPGLYGVYAQSLAEMIRTGGLSLPEVFDRVRLRVNDASKGAQVPWDDQKISAQFAFFERGPDAPPAQAAPDQVAAIRSKPIRDLGVQDAYAAALERDTLPAYEEFLAAYPGDPLAKRVMAIVAARREAVTWRRTYRTDTPEAYWSYLRRYPRGPHAGDARRRLAILTAPVEPPPSFAMIDYDVPPPPPEEVVYVDRPVLLFGDPVFGFVPPPPPPVYYLPPPPPDFIVLAPPLAVVGLFVLPQPVFVPIPVFVRPPVYVAPPPNNIVFQNIHNTTVINTVINRPVAPPPPGNVAAAAAVAAGTASAGAATHVPSVVRDRALAVQKNPTQPLNPSQAAFVSNPTAKPGTMVPTKANLAPNNAAPVTSTPLQGHALPLPDPKTGTAPARAGAQPAVEAPNSKPGPTATAPANGLPPHPSANTTAPANAGPSTTPTSKPPVAQTPAPGRPDQRAKSLAHEPAVTPPTGTPAGKPAVTSAKPTPVSPPVAAREQFKPQNQQNHRAAPAPVQAAKPAPPPQRPQAVARPTPPPPPRAAAPPPRPPVAAARPAPPPAARPAPPPRVAAAPPRPAAPPPPRPAAPKKCPPNQPRC